MFNKRLLKYEFRNMFGSWYTPFFGIVFPIVFSIVLGNTVFKNIPEQYRKDALTSLFIGMSLIIPMAVLLIGYAVTYAQEIEKNIHTRLELFGISKQEVFRTRLIAQFVFISFAVTLYSAIDFMLLDISPPTFKGAIIILLALYTISVSMFFLGHGLATLFGSFGPTYAASMFLYFFFMFVSGLLGPRLSDLPKGIRTIAKTLPMSYYSDDFVKVWNGESYNFAPFIQSLIFLFGISILVMLLGLYRRRRKEF